MEPDDLMRTIATERRALCDFLDPLTPDEWEEPSLCLVWSVHDVLAHLTTTAQTSVWDTIVATVRARGSFDRMTADTARARAQQFGPAELIAQLRATADSPRRAPLSKPADLLVDVLVHGQDIARPLGRDLPMPPDHVVPALDRAVDSVWYGAPKRLKDVRLVATDTAWDRGAGEQEVHGPSGALLLVATGRVAGLGELRGSGVPLLAARLEPS